MKPGKETKEAGQEITNWTQKDRGQRQLQETQDEGLANYDGKYRTRHTQRKGRQDCLHTWDTSEDTGMRRVWTFYDDKISGVETSVLNYDSAKILILLSKQAVNIYAWVF